MKLKRTQIVGFIFTVVLGSLLHFVFEWSGGNPLVGAFAAVNESVWEHLKLLTTPMLLYGVYEYFAYGRKQANFLPVRLLSILLGMALIITAFNTYSGIIGRHFLIVDIILFIAAIFAAYSFSYKMLQGERFSSPCAIRTAILGFLLLIALIVVFTFNPPHINLFLDTETGAYGITKQHNFPTAA